MITGTAPVPDAGMLLSDFTTMPSDQQLLRMYSSLSSGGGLRYGTIIRINGSGQSALSAGPFQDASDAARDTLPLVNQLVILPRLPPVANETQAEYTARYRLFAASGGLLTFSRKGDSGSVVVDNQQGGVNIIGLLVREYPAAAIRDDLKCQGKPIPDVLMVVENLGIVTPIENVLAQMQIAIPGRLAGTVPATRADRSQRLGASPALASGFDREGMEAAIERLWARTSERRHGALIAAKFDEHRREVGRLVNTERRISATWIRGQGPAFMHHLLISLRDPAHRVPNVINGATFADLLRHMQPLLAQYGSNRLRRDMRRLGPFAINLLTSMNNIYDLPDALPSYKRNRS